MTKNNNSSTIFDIMEVAPKQRPQEQPQTVKPQMDDSVQQPTLHFFGQFNTSSWSLK